ncbi:7-keto-8-aminopelargonate synthetase-like enzyme [Chitinophaga skermanii]|uniref:7-keto-8-aminopelargonate synthetase-like enzyme n=1 Tax=Chitinophaga skermanii TaxID=331697 RepID=A0A327QN01_9BACT|nr:aminotransferase class I/II-fold pyridoxal phosphate-dependent enzyme [Chitinophaga skermanii]RAJ05255.1 7-keto-8-aminopelargonate synthetase-like enzyme [Chitinophaga skermanii]
MLQTHETPGRNTTAGANDKQYLFFSGFAYLGMHRDQLFLQYLVEGLGKYGSLYPSSRIANVQLHLYDEIEHALCGMLYQQAAACFSSGYLASQAAIAFAHTKGQVLYAPGTHPSLQQTPILPSSANFGDWLQTEVDKINAEPGTSYVIVADTVSPLTATINDFSALANVQQKTWVLLDDSHGFGLLGENGEGIISQLPLNDHIQYLVAASLSKAYSAEGGVVAGPAAAIAAIKRLPHFSASTPMMPANAYAFLQAMPLYNQARKRLRENCAAFAAQINSLQNIRFNPLLSIFLLNDLANATPVYDYLLEHDVLISSFSYPSPDSPKINRAVISAVHEANDLALLSRLLLQYYQSM